MHTDIFQLVSYHDYVDSFRFPEMHCILSPSYCYIPYTGAKQIDLSSLIGLDNSIPIVLDDVACSGNEVRLIDCDSSKSHNCLHFEDVAVHCNRDG